MVMNTDRYIYVWAIGLKNVVLEKLTLECIVEVEANDSTRSGVLLIGRADSSSCDLISISVNTNYKWCNTGCKV